MRVDWMKRIEQFRSAAGMIFHGFPQLGAVCINSRGFCWILGVPPNTACSGLPFSAQTDFLHLALLSSRALQPVIINLVNISVSLLARIIVIAIIIVIII